MHVLIVDDDPMLRRVLAAILEDGGHTHIWAAGGVDALAQMRRESPHVVLLDINLGKGLMSGWDVLREKLLDDRIRHIPVIILSGMTQDEIHEGARVVDDALSGALVILGKPVATQILLAALSRIDPTPRTDPAPAPDGEG